MSHPFFAYHGPISIDTIGKLLKININNSKNSKIKDVKDLSNANENSLTFLHSNKYIEIAKSTKASFCLTTDLLKNNLPNNCKPIIVDNVLVAISMITQKLYPSSIEDEFDKKVKNIENIDLKNNVEYGKNVLVGENVTIGSNSLIGHNSIIEKNVKIGNNCKIGSNTIIRNSIIKDNVTVLDNCVIGKKDLVFSKKF